MHEVLKWHPTPDQGRIARKLPGRVKVNSGHNVGKTSLAAGLASWWFDTRNPGVVITTAPTERDVVDLLWTEIRLIRGRVGLPSPYIGPRAPQMFDNDEHYAKGYTARKGESFHGRHRPNMFFIFDECEGVDPPYWAAADTMFQPDMGHAFLAIGNPLGTASQSSLEDLAEKEDGTPKWERFNISAIDHPNITAQLAGLPCPIPNAITLGQIQQLVQDLTTPVEHEEDRVATDIEWPPGSGKYVRPGPMFKGRVLGIRPVEGVDTVFGTGDWEKMLVPRMTPHQCWMKGYGIDIGCDVATFGDDFTVMHVRCGPLSLHHESRNGWLPDQTAERLKELAHSYTVWYNSLQQLDRPLYKPANVRVTIELDGPGVGVISHCKGFGDWRGLTVSEKAFKESEYPDKRSEMWFDAKELAARGEIDLSRLPLDTRRKLRLQLLAPAYTMEVGRRRVESKKDIKKRVKRSPDDADGFLVSHYRTPSYTPYVIEADQNHNS